MWRRTSRIDPKVVRCSFCRKSEDAVAKLISSPADYASVFICDECVAVCQSLLEDHRSTKEAGNAGSQTETHPPLDAWFVTQLVDAVERWITKESARQDAAREFEQMRRWATCLIPNPDEQESHRND